LGDHGRISDLDAGQPPPSLFEHSKRAALRNRRELTKQLHGFLRMTLPLGCDRSLPSEVVVERIETTGLQLLLPNLAEPTPMNDGACQLETREVRTGAELYRHSELMHRIGELPATHRGPEHRCACDVR